MQHLFFSEINLNDPFFDSLKADYAEFETWYKGKVEKNEKAIAVCEESGELQGFLYLKTEIEEVIDISPPLPPRRRTKVGTLKVNPHGTRLGERFLKKIFDFSTIEKAEEIYVTIFPKHAALIELFKKYGFKRHGSKTSDNGTEDVLLKQIAPVNGSVVADYPLIKTLNTSKYLLSIHPTYHSRLFADSLLNSETFDIITDVSYTNSIHKIYVCYMDVSVLKPGDNVVIYRTSDGAGPAHYRSVATSIAVVEELKTKKNFGNLIDYLNYCKDYSIFTKEELTDFYNAPKRIFFVIKMTYNAAFAKRVNRAKLLEQVKLDGNAYFGFLKLTDVQFKQILNLGGVSESIIVD